MKVVLEVIEGIDKGEKFVIKRNESDNIIVGRSKRTHSQFQDKYSQLQITKEDLYFSRWHFLLQIRPPHCYIRDTGSTNHTYVNDFKKENWIKETLALKNGDIIKAGRTHIKVYIFPEKEKEVRYYCVSCKKELPELGKKAPEDLKQEDFLCAECRQKREKAREAAWKKKKKKILCFQCGKDVMDKANTDGCAGELMGIALYLCEDCAHSESKEDLREIGEYKILQELGQGGMGVVYKAWHKPTGRLVALKKILPEREMDKRSLKRFYREISMVQQLVHPNIIRFYNSGIYKGKPYFVCEYMPKGNVEERLLERKKHLPIKEACGIILDVLEGLSYAHKKGIVHRDIKPSNMLFTNDNKVKLADMGIAKSYETAGQSTITKKGEAGGTLIYMAPEQILNYRFVKPPADVYSVGVSLYYMLTGKFPYEFPTTLDRLLGLFGHKKVKDPILIILEDRPIPIRKRNSRIPKSLAQVVDKAINKDEGSRYPSAKEMREAIRSVVKEV